MKTEEACVGNTAPWEQIIGYCRAIKVGHHIEVAGTTSVDKYGNVIGEGDVYEQSKFILHKISSAVNELGGNITEVTRTRVYLTDIRQWEQAAMAHQEIFMSHTPVCTMVEIGKLIDPKLLVEIEVSVILKNKH